MIGETPVAPSPKLKHIYPPAENLYEYNLYKAWT